MTEMDYFRRLLLIILIQMQINAMDKQIDNLV
jgi:hypothetical protein